MAALELSDDSEAGDGASGLKNSTMSRLQQESESFLASLQSTPDLSSTVKTAKMAKNKSLKSSSKHAMDKFSKLQRLDVDSCYQ